MALSFIFDAEKGETPETLKRKRAIAQALLGYSTPKNVGEGIGAVARGLAAGIMNGRADSAESAGRANATSTFNSIFGASGSNPGSELPVTTSANLPASEVQKEIADTAPGKEVGSPSTAGGSLPTSFLAAIDHNEGAGSYDTLYGHAQRKGPFAGTDVSRMSVGEALAFADPSGDYAQHVKGQIGRVATPMGRHQIVGTTLKNAVNELGIDPATPFNAETQDTIAAHLARRRLAGSSTLDGKIAALRSEWHGLKNVPRNQMEQIVADLESGGGRQAMAQPQAPIQVASVDPDRAMAYAATQPTSAIDAIEAQAPASGYVDPVVSAQPQPAPPQLPAAQPQEMAALPPQQQPMEALPPLPAREIGPAPAVASVPAAAPAATAQASPDQQVAQALMRPQRAGGPSVEQLMQLAQDPWLTDGQMRMIDFALRQKVSEQQDERERAAKQADPTYQLGLEKLRAEVKELLNPKPKFDYFESGGDRYRLNTTDPNAKPEMVLDAPDAPKAPTIETFYDPEGREYKAQWNSADKKWDPVGGSKLPSGMSIKTNPDGSVELVQGAGAAKGFTEAQSKDVVFATRARGALPTANKFADNLANYGDRLMDSDPTGLVRGNFQSEDYQVGRTAADEFLQAILRKDTGAAITSQEQELYGTTYFPVPGDGPEVKKYKAEARERAIAAVEAGMSPAQMLVQEKALAKASGIGKNTEIPAASNAPVSPEARAPQQDLGNLPRPTTDEEFDALPSGTRYIDPDDNKQYRKP